LFYVLRLFALNAFGQPSMDKDTHVVLIGAHFKCLVENISARIGITLISSGLQGALHLSDEQERLLLAMRCTYLFSTQHAKARISPLSNLRVLYGWTQNVIRSNCDP
jgi:hypothetical protein